MPYFLQRVVRKPAGSLIIDGQDQDTVMCLHCQMVWVPEPGLGRKRGWCFNCAGPTCGKQRCEVECKHWEKVIEEMEARSRIEHNLSVLRS